jgi:hypothetical protein
MGFAAHGPLWQLRCLVLGGGAPEARVAVATCVSKPSGFDT